MSKQIIQAFEKALERCGWHLLSAKGGNKYIKPIGFTCLCAVLNPASSETIPIYTMICLIVSTDFDRDDPKAWENFHKMKATNLRGTDLNLVFLNERIKDSLTEEDDKQFLSWEWEIKLVEQELVLNIDAPVVSKVRKVGKRWLVTPARNKFNWENNPFGI